MELGILDCFLKRARFPIGGVRAAKDNRILPILLLFTPDVFGVLKDDLHILKYRNELLNVWGYQLEVIVWDALAG